MRIILRDDRDISSTGPLSNVFSDQVGPPHLLALFDGFTVVGGMAHNQENGYEAGDQGADAA
jgi:hypothetical protein